MSLASDASPHRSATASGQIIAAISMSATNPYMPDERMKALKSVMGIYRHANFAQVGLLGQDLLGHFAFSKCEEVVIP